MQHHQQQHHHQHPDGAHYDPARNHTLINNPMSALSQLNPQVSRSAVPHGSPSPPGSKSATPSPSSSNQEEETDPHLKVLVWLLWLVVVELKAYAWQCFSQVVHMLTAVLSSGAMAMFVLGLLGCLENSNAVVHFCWRWSCGCFISLCL